MVNASRYQEIKGDRGQRPEVLAWRCPHCDDYLITTNKMLERAVLLDCSWATVATDPSLSSPSSLQCSAWTLKSFTLAAWQS
jgi:hypothetical protein